MKKIFIATVTSLTVVCSPAYAGWLCDCDAPNVSDNQYLNYTDEGRWYLRGDAGYGVADVNADSPLGPFQENGQSFLGSVGMGYYFLDEIRVELAANYYHGYEADKTFAGVNIEAKESTISGMVNLYYDWLNSTSWTPYGMLGVGYAQNEFEVTVAGVSVTKKSNSFAYQLGGGVSYRFNNDWLADLGYRFTSNGENRYEITAGGTVVSGKVDRSHNALLGLRYLF